MAFRNHLRSSSNLLTSVRRLLWPRHFEERSDEKSLRRWPGKHRFWGFLSPLRFVRNDMEENLELKLLKCPFAIKLVCLGLALLVLSLVCGRVIAKADGPSKQDRPEIRVVTKEIEPFVFKEGGRLTGFSIDLWEDIAQQAGFEFEYVEVTTVGEQLEAVEAGDADLAIAAISVTQDREERVDFSYPYYTSGLLIMTPVWSPVSFRKLLPGKQFK